MMGMESLSAVVSTVMMSFVMNGVPVQARFMQANAHACDLVRRQALEWRQQKHMVVEKRVAEWCVAGTTINGRWVSVQWRQSDPRSLANGWHVEIPLQSSSRSVLEAQAPAPWAFDLQDRSINTRIRFRQSPSGLSSHHLDSSRWAGAQAKELSTDPRAPIQLSRLRDGQILLSGRHPEGGAYSVLIERGAYP